MTFRNKKKQRLNRGKSFEKLEMIEDIGDMLIDGQASLALPILREATRKYPSEVKFWGLLAFAGSELKDARLMQEAFGMLIKMMPKNPENWHGLAQAYGMGDFPGLCYTTLREYLRRFPDDDRFAEVSEMADLLKAEMPGKLAELAFPATDEGLELICLHEEAQVLLHQDKLAAAKEKAEKLISRMPDFTPAYNNLSLILFMNGEAERAVDAARATLVKHAENCHALANLVQYSLFLGRPDEAKNYANRLRVVDSVLPDVWVKKMEAFTFIGDHEAVIEVYRLTRKTAAFAGVDNFCKHLAAYAFFQLGEEKEARKLWRKILKDDPNYDLAVENLEQIDLPQNERIVYALVLGRWVPRHYIAELVEETGKLKEGRSFEKNFQKKIARFFEKNPNILGVLPILLERGDQAGKDFALRLLRSAATPESFAALKEFAFSQNGTDQMRHKTAMALAEADVIPKDVRLWVGGEWHEMRLQIFDVSSEKVVTYPLKPKAEHTLAKGFEAMQSENLEVAEQYFKMALMNNGADHPSILYNLLMVQELKGTATEAEEKLGSLVERFPEYIFAAITLARLKLGKGNLDEARALTERFQEKKKWHVGEIGSWLLFNIELALKEKAFDSARMSLDMLRHFTENLDYEYWERMIMTMEAHEKGPAMRSKKKKENKRDA